MSTFAITPAPIASARHLVVVKGCRKLFTFHYVISLYDSFVLWRTPAHLSTFVSITDSDESTQAGRTPCGGFVRTPLITNYNIKTVRGYTRNYRVTRK